MSGHREQLLVVHKWTGERQQFDLDKQELVIGRQGVQGDERDAPDVALDSRMVSAVHGILRHSDAGWTIRHMGNNDIRLDDEVLPSRSERPIAHYQAMQIGEFTLSIVPVTEAEHSRELETGEQRLAELEKSIHAALLVKLDLRSGKAIFDLSDSGTRDTIIQALDQEIEQALEKMDPADFDLLVQLAVYRRLSYRLLASGSRDSANGQGTGEPLGDPLAHQLGIVESRLARQMKIGFSPSRMEEDVALLDSIFDKTVEAFVLDFTPGLKKYAVASVIRTDLHQLVFGLGPLQDFLEMDCVSEIMVVSQDQIFVEKFGVVEDSRRSFPSRESLMKVIERIVEPVNRRINVGSPLVDARLLDGSRVNIVIPPLAIKGPCVTIRKFSKVPLTVDDLVGFGALSEPLVKFLRSSVEQRKNIFISGGTGTGKTTLLNCFSSFIPHKERVVTIEDTAELQLQQRHVVTLEARPANVENKGEVTIGDLVRNALRMRPDRIIVGECRGSEAMDMLKAMNTGHEGSMATGHANSPEDMMLRLETMILEGSDMPVSAIRSQIASALDLVVQLKRFPNGARCISHITEVGEIDDETGRILLEDIFVAFPAPVSERPNMRFRHTGYIPTFIDQILMQGNGDLEAFF